MDRRDFLKSGVVASAAAFAASSTIQSAAVEAKPARFQKGVSPFALIMNSSTLRGTPLKDQVRLVAEAGWDGIEPWTEDLEKFEAAGGDVKALGKEIADRGLRVSNVIGLWDCMPYGDEAFNAALTSVRNRMRLASAVGSPFVAAIPLPDHENFDLAYASRRYRDLMKIGRDDYNITPIVEFVGFFKGVNHLGQAAAIALDADLRDAYILPDTFHLWRGGSGFNGISRLQGDFIADFHWNDVPAGTSRETAGDEVRVLPGDGALPLVQCVKDLAAIGYKRGLSLEIFNRELWKKEPKYVCEIGLRKMTEVVAAAGV